MWYINCHSMLWHALNASASLFSHTLWYRQMDVSECWISRMRHVSIPKPLSCIFWGRSVTTWTDLWHGLNQVFCRNEDNAICCTYNVGEGILVLSSVLHVLAIGILGFIPTLQLGVGPVYLKKKSKKCVAFTSQILGLGIIYIFLFCYSAQTRLNTQLWLIDLHGMGKSFMLNTNLLICQSGFLLTFLVLYGGVSTFFKGC